MAGESLGTIRGQMILDVKQALASYTATRQAHIATVTALHTGAGAMVASGAAIAGVGAAMVAGFGVAISAAAEFERRLDFFTAVSNTTQAEYDAIRQKALQLGADTIYSANQIAESFIELGKSGVAAKDIIDGIGEGVASLGAAADIPLDTAANIITAAVSTFQLGADKAVMVADRLAGAANASIVDVDDLGLSLKYAGGVAASLKIPFEDVNTALAILGKNGIKGSTAGTALRQVFLRLTGTTAKSRKALEELGIITADGGNKFFTASGQAKSLAEIFQILQDATAGMSDEQRTATMQQIFATRALPSLIALTRAGADGFSDMAEAIQNTSAMEVAGKRLDNLSGDLEVLRGNLDTLMISSGSGFQSFARFIVQGITSMVQAFLDLPPAVQTVIAAIFGSTGALLVFVGTAGMIAGAILNIIALAIQMGPVLATLAKAWGIVRGAMIAAAAVMTKNPFGIIITAIALLVGAFMTLYATSETFRSAVQPLFAAVVGIFEKLTPLINTAVTWLSNFFTTVMEGAGSGLSTLIGMLSQLASALGGALITALSVILPPIMELVDMLMAGLMPVIQALIPLIEAWAAVFEAVFSGNMEALPGLIENFASSFTTLVDAIANSLIPAIVNIATTILTTLIGMLPTLVQVGVQIVTTLIQAIVTALPMIINAALQLVTTLITSLVSMIPMLVQAGLQLILGLLNAVIVALPMIIQAGIQLVTGLITGITTALPLIIQSLIGIIPVLIQTITTAVPMIIEAGITLFTGLVTALVTAIPQIITALVEAIPQILESLIGMIPMLIESAITFFLGIVTGLAEAIPQIITAIVEAIPQLVSALVNMIPKIIDGALKLFLGIVKGLAKALPKIISAVIEMIPEIVGALVDAVPDLLDAGVQLIQGLINGIGSMAGALWDAATSIASNALNAIKEFFGIASPSRVMADQGVFLIQGLMNGMESLEGAAVKTVTSIADSMASVPFEFASLAGMYDQLAAAQSMYDRFNTNSNLGVEASQLIKLAESTDEQQAPGDTTYDITINNPEPEKASESLPRTIRKIAYVNG